MHGPLQLTTAGHTRSDSTPLTRLWSSDTIDSELDSGVEVKIICGLTMIIVSTLSLEDYQRYGGLQAVEKCQDNDLCRKGSHPSASRKVQTTNVIVKGSRKLIKFIRINDYAMT
jgi:hypothetical protein